MHECNTHFCVLSISSLTSWDVTAVDTSGLVVVRHLRCSHSLRDGFVAVPSAKGLLK
jgi:hypothetical protein